MNRGFSDHFSSQAADYARYRPTYPPALIAALAQAAPARALAIDVGAGNGQCALALARHFEQVIATEPSAAQLANAIAHPRVEYRCESAEKISLAAGSADLLTAAQAAHWFDWPVFVDEAQRVLRPDGVLAIWTYGVFEVSPRVDALVQDFYRDVVGPYWPRERSLVEEGYRSLAFPFQPLDLPAPVLELQWSAADGLAYLSTWSSVQRYRVRRGQDPLAALAPVLSAVWGAGQRCVRWPLSLRAGRKI